MAPLLSPTSRQAEQLLYTASSQIPQLEQQIQQEENAIKLLLGEKPRLHRPGISERPHSAPAGHPNRPPVTASRAPPGHSAGRSHPHRGQRADRRSPRPSSSRSSPSPPRRELAAERSPTSSPTDSKTIYGIGTLTQPIFAGGKLRGQLNLSERTKEEMVITYQKTITGALRDVSNALIALKKQHKLPHRAGKNS